MPSSRRARGRLREVAAFPAETRKKANNGSRPALCEPRQAEGAQPGMAKFKAGQGAGRAGMLMGAARGLWRHGAGGSGALRAVTLRGREHPKTTLLRGNGA